MHLSVRPAAQRRFFIAVALLVSIVAFKLELITIESRDFTTFLGHWVAFVRTHGAGKAYGYNFSNYSPLYTYFFGLFAVLFPHMRDLYVIKCVTFIGEGLAAFYTYKMVALYYRDSFAPYAAVLLLLATPSVMANGAIIAQCDIWWTAFLLGAVYYILCSRPTMALIYFGLAISFKLMAIFLGPLFLLCLLKGNIPWRGIWIVPAVYITTCIPAWIEGRPILNLLDIYWTNFAGGGLNANAGNIYLYLHGSTKWISASGLLLAVELGCLFVYLSYKRWPAQPQIIDTILLATLMAGIMPFVLPGMHDRYFFAADVFSLVLGCLCPRWFMITALFQLASLMVVLDWQFPHTVMWWGWPMWQRLRVATWVNATAIAMLFWLCYQHIWKRNPLPLADTGR